MKKLSGQAGVTLIEILIAVSLLGLLTGGVLIAMQLGFKTMDKTDARLVSNRRVANARKIIENEIYGFVSTQAEFLRPDSITPETVPFLQGDPQSMRFVSAYSLEDGWRGRPQLTEWLVIPGENGQGVRLVINETPYTGPRQTGLQITAIEVDKDGLPLPRFRALQAGPRSFVLADKLAFCRLSFLERLDEKPFQLWRTDWAQTRRLPLGIRIEMAPLDTSSADLHVTTVMVPLNVNSQPGMLYADR